VGLVDDPTLDEILEFCAEDPVERVFLEDIARRGVGRFYGIRARRRLRALCHVGANVVPSGRGCDAFARIAAGGSGRMYIGEERAVTDLWDASKRLLPPPREDRRGQPVYDLRDPPEPGDTELREATLDDLELLVPVCAAAHELELGIDPLARDADGFRRRTRAQIEEGRSWIWRDGDTILFKAEASAWTPQAIQLQQVWTDPEVRRRGYAKRGLRDLCGLLLRRVPIVTLFVRADNDVAIRLYDTVGMRQVLTYRSVLF
jgi:hypothetical protein